jgi:hypothetical protein
MLLVIDLAAYLGKIPAGITSKAHFLEKKWVVMGWIDA